ncbi:hypothetical protein EMIT0196MI5_100083 [Pseudomonas sp. IT-196MI5]
MAECAGTGLSLVLPEPAPSRAGSLPHFGLSRTQVLYPLKIPVGASLLAKGPIRPEEITAQRFAGQSAGQ